MRSSIHLQTGLFRGSILEALPLHVCICHVTRQTSAVVKLTHTLAAGIYDTYNRDNKVPMLSDPVTDVDTALVADRCACVRVL